MKVFQVTPPSIEPISLDELKADMNIAALYLDDDDMLTAKIKEARAHVEDVTRRAIITQTWDYYLQSFPSGNAFKLPFGNLQSVTHVKYTDSDGTQTTMTAGTDYIVETNGEQCGRIVLPYAETWPSFTEYPSNPIVVRFVCGWTSAAAVPSKIRAACKLMADDLCTNREMKNVSSVMALLASYRLWEEFP